MGDPADCPKHNDLTRAPAMATPMAADYFTAALSEFRLMHFVINAALSQDYLAFVAKTALDGSEDYKRTTPSELAVKAPGPATKFIRENRQLLLEMFLARLVDNFQKYLVDLVRSVLRAKPEMLSTKAPTVSLEDILRHDSLEEFLQEVIEQRVTMLSYRGFNELQDWCTRKGLPIVVPAAQQPLVVELIATRNLIIHNRGRVDERYRTLSASAFTVGSIRTLKSDDLFEGMRLFHGVVAATDKAASEKFGLMVESVSIPGNAQES